MTLHDGSILAHAGIVSDHATGGIYMLQFLAKTDQSYAGRGDFHPAYIILTIVYRGPRKAYEANTANEANTEGQTF